MVPDEDHRAPYVGKHLPAMLGVDEARQLLDEDCFFDLAVEKCRFHVHVVDHPREVPDNAQQESYRLQSCHRRKNILKVDSLCHIPPLSKNGQS
jgi:hypothetical protein